MSRTRNITQRSVPSAAQRSVSVPYVLRDRAHTAAARLSVSCVRPRVSSSVFASSCCVPLSTYKSITERDIWHANAQRAYVVRR